MFKVVAEPTFTHKVKVKVPVDGGFADETCKVTYRVIDPDKAESFNLGTAQGSTDFLLAVVVSMDDVADAQGQPVPWNDQVRDQVFRLPYARQAIARGYFEAMVGAKQGN